MHHQSNKIAHLALAQFFSWCSIYEKAFSKKVLTQKMNELVTDDISLTNIDGTLIGKEKFLQRLLILHKLQNAHHIKNVNLKFNNDKTILITADARYQNILPDSTSNSYLVKWHFEMVFINQGFPKIKTLKVETVSIMENEMFLNNYVTNRTLSFIHYWIFLFNHKRANLYEVFSDTTKFDIAGYEEIKYFHDFILWAEKNKICDGNISNAPKNFHVFEKHNDEIFAFFELEMETNEGKLIHTKHEWVLSNNSEDRFPQIIKMSIVIS
jgi:hypothetical protein